MSATELAAKLQPGSAVRWDRLERAAFAAHPEVLEERRSVRGRIGRSYWNLIWMGPLVLVYLALYLAPIWGYAAIYSGPIASAAPDPDPAQAIPVSGFFYLCTLALLLISLVHWLITGRKRNGFYQVQAWLALVLGVLTALSVRVKGERDAVENWQSWTAIILSVAAFAAIILIVHLVVNLSRINRGESTEVSGVMSELPPDKVSLFGQRRERLARLSEVDQTAIASDIHKAVEDLRARGLISEAEAQRANAAELGALALRMPRTPARTR